MAITTNLLYCILLNLRVRKEFTMNTVELTPKTKALTVKSKALLEVSMMNGQVTLVNNESLRQVLLYCLPALTKLDGYNRYVDSVMDTVFHQYNRTNKDREVVAISFNTIQDMVCLTFILNDEEQPCTPALLESGTPAFCYVLNITENLFSEFGYCYFEHFKRIS